MPVELYSERQVGAFTGTERFSALAFLGRGGAGVVYRVLDRETGAEVALKTLHTRDPDQLYRLKQEFRGLVGIAHPNLVQLHELVVSDSQCFFTMEFVDGVNFTDYICAGGARDPAGGATSGLGAPVLERLYAATRQLVHGLSALHERGKLHRDVKPSNILVSRDQRVVLLDFGLVTALGLDAGRDTVSGSMVGTPAYMAPEQGWGKPPSPAADWYSVGVVLYEALTGRLPFEGPPGRVLMQKTESQPPAARTFAADIPDRLDNLVTALLDPDPAHRPGPEEILARLDSSRVLSVPTVRTTAAEDQAPFVGRTAEMARLRSIFSSLERGRAAIVRLHGPSGVGKTELTHRFLAPLEQSGRARVLRGRCHPQEDVPYKALDTLVDELSRLLIAMPASRAAAVVPRYVGALTRLFPVLGRVPVLAGSATAEDSAEPYRGSAARIRRAARAAGADRGSRAAGVVDRRPSVGRSG